MALLEIIHLTGDVERRDLYKRQPMTIGSHASNDLRIDEEGVEIMHCRISWNKENWEAVAAGTSPFDLNGTAVQRATLTSGDTLRFGTVDVRFHGGATVEDTPKDTIGIKPTSEEAILATRDLTKGQKAAEPKKPSPPPPEKMKSPQSDEALMQSLEMLAFDSKAPSGGSKKKASADDGMFEVVEDEHEERPAKPAAKPTAKAAPKKTEVVEDEIEDFEEETSPAKPGIATRLKKVLATPEVRPGEQDPLKSPLVLGLIGGCSLLVLLGFTFYFIAFRRIAETEFELAKGKLSEGKFKEGGAALQSFVEYFPKHEKTPEAKLLIGLAKIDEKIGAGGGNYAEGIKSIRDFVTSNGEEPNFETMKSEIATRAGNAALGAAVQAGKTPKVGKALLATAAEARTLFTSYSPKDAQPVEKVNQINLAIKTSDDLIRKFSINETSTAEIKQANTDKKPMEALRLRRELLAQYPEYANDKAFRTLLNESMEVERSLVRGETPNTPANTADAPATLPLPRTLMYHARTGTDQVSVGEVAWVLSKDCLYGADTVTGMPAWRRITGSDPPFFPVEESAMPSLIYFDSDTNELVRVKQANGELVWRQSLGDRAASKPLIKEGQIYVTTVAGTLLKIELESGAILSTLTFSQPVNGPTLISLPKKSGEEKTSESHLVVVGDQDVVYTLSMRPLECVAVSYFAQKSASVVAPLISMGSYAAFVENHSETSSTLRLVKRDGEKVSLVEAGTGKINGMVVDESVIRGPDLYVPSTVERVNAFSVSDSANEPALTTGPSFQVQGARGSAIYLSPGPEKQVWMSSSALRRLQLVTDTIQVDPKVEAVGLSSQPIQRGDVPFLFNARRRPFTDAVTLTQTDRETLTSEWQLLAGARLLTLSIIPGSPPTLLTVNEGGAIFRVTAAELAQEDRFQTEAAFRLPIKEETVQPLAACALADSQIAVVCGDPEPRIWVINRLGQVERQGTLPASPQAAPVPLGKRIVVPLEGKLHVARTGQGDSVIQDFTFPSGEAPPVWKQVLAVDDKTLIGLTEAGELLQFRLESKSNLSQIARQPLPGPAVGKLAMSEGRFAVACSTGEVLLFDANKFEPQGQRTLEIAASGAAYVTEAGVLVETGNEDLHCLNADAELTTKWSIKLSGSTLAGQPMMIEGHLVLAFESGLVLCVNPETGALVSEQQAAGSLDSGPLSLGDTWFLTTWDGSLIPLTAVKP